MIHDLFMPKDDELINEINSINSFQGSKSNSDVNMGSEASDEDEKEEERK
jgi:hypothetical protein